jgi:hypothetical protein
MESGKKTMKVTNKATVVLALFFILVYGLSILSTTLVSMLAESSKSILKDNYASVNYSVNMLKALFQIQSLFTDQLVMGSNDTLSQSYIEDKFSEA